MDTINNQNAFYDNGPSYINSGIDYNSNIIGKHILTYVDDGGGGGVGDGSPTGGVGIIQNATVDKILFEGYSDGLLTFASICCIIFILIGVPGNLITIIALARCKKVRNATAAFIINLSLSDLLFCCFNLPLATLTFWRHSWSWSENNILCRLFPLMRYGLLAVSDFSVLAITINRYVMIGHPRLYQKIYRRRQLGFMILLIWVSAFLSLIPTYNGIWGQFGLDENMSCTIIEDSNGVTPKEFFFVMAFIVPCVFIIVCYARIFYIVRKTAMKSHDPVLTTNSVRILGKSQQSINKDTDRHLLEKVSKTSKDETSSSSATSNSGGNIIGGHGGGGGGGGISNNIGGYPPPLLATMQATNQQQQTKPLLFKPFLSKIRDDELKFIDTSIESLNPPNMLNSSFREKRDGTPTAAAAAIVESIKEDVNEDCKDTIDINNTNDIKLNINLKNNDDSAYETVTNSLLSNNSNNLYHITNNSAGGDGAGRDGITTGAINIGNGQDNQLMAIHIEPSSTSGVGELPLDSPENNPKKRRFLRKSIKNSLNRITSKKNKNNDVGIENGGGGGGGGIGKKCRKASSAFLNNTSAASVLYPGRMSQKDRRLLKMISVIFLSFVICYLPITITKIWKGVTKIHFVNIMGYLLIYLTTCINPIIYVVMSSEYRQAYWNLLLCRTNIPGRGPGGGGGGGGGGGRRGSAPLMPSKRKTSKPNVGSRGA